MWRLLMAFSLIAIPSIAGAAADDPPIQIGRTTDAIKIDGVLDEAAWKEAARIDRWFEVSPGDNTEPIVKSVAWITHDDDSIYVALQFDDPNPSLIRSPLGDHDQISGSGGDYGGIMIDPRGDRKSAVEFMATPDGIQYDAVMNEASGVEDSSPNYFWESVGKVTATGWQLEMRIPFSALRYDRKNVSDWGILFLRNYPRDRRYQLFSARQPRQSNCFVCILQPMRGFDRLPSGGSMTLAPYVTSGGDQRALGAIGSALGDRVYEHEVGGDLKWTPMADMAIDLTVNPDFSQIESDAAQITANERFAIQLPEKRPFFLEGVDLLDTPLDVVHTRAITSPEWGARSTGSAGKTSYTLMLSRDGGGGSLIVPGTNSSSLALQGFESTFTIGRLKHSLGGSSLAGLVVTSRENEGGSYNRVIGPDFQWRPTNRDSITGQLLFSDTKNPDRPDLSPGWNGEELSSYAGTIAYSHSGKLGWDLRYSDIGQDFRADSGFIPQVGYRHAFGHFGYNAYPKGFFHRVHACMSAARSEDREGTAIFEQLLPSISATGRRSTELQLQFASDKVYSGGTMFDRERVHYSFFSSPTSKLIGFGVRGWVGEDVDHAHTLLGNGASITMEGKWWPNHHLDIRPSGTVRWLDVDGQRSFTAQVERVKATWTLDSRRFIRAVVQNVRTDSDETLVGEMARNGNLSGSVLLAYKLNWQSVVFIGYGETQDFDDDLIATTGKQLFFKFSYAFQR